MHTSTPAVAAPARPVSSVIARGLYVGIAMAASLIVLVGFWPFYSTLFSGGSGAHWIIYLHAAVFTGWIVLFATQVVLAFRRRIRTHQDLGRLGAYYGLVVLILGLAVTFVATAQNVVAGRSSLDEAAGFLVLPIGDVLLFSGFFGAGLLYRRKKEVHKRLMVLATIALLFAPAARIGGDAGLMAILAVWLLPLAMAILHDAVVTRQLQRVYVIGTAVLLVAFARIALMTAEPWLVIGRWMLQSLI